MTFTDDILACLMPGFAGPVAPNWLLDLAGNGLGSVCLFGSNIVGPDELRALTSTLHTANPDLLIAIDEEGGDVTRLDVATGSRTPGNAALGFLDDPATTQAAAFRLGRRLAAFGIDWTLAPVADVNCNPDNPVIGTRSFGADPALVARHCAAFVRGLGLGGVASCAKHFPGHGDTNVDSHAELPTLDLSIGQLLSRELVPFVATIEAGVDAVMFGHLRVPEVDDRAASLSPRMYRELLRERLGFGGLAVTDAVDMAGVCADRGIVTATIEALRAGADVVCLGTDTPQTTIDEVLLAAQDAERRGELVASEIRDRADRIRMLARRVRERREDGDDSEPDEAHVEAFGPSESVNPSDDDRDADVARRSLEIRVGKRARTRRGLQVLDVISTPTIAAGRVPCGIAAALKEMDASVTGMEIDADYDQSTLDLACPTVIAVRDLQHNAWQAALIERAAAAGGLSIVVDLGWPSPVSAELAARLIDVTWIWSRSASLVSRRAVARWIVED